MTPTQMYQALEVRWYRQHGQHPDRIYKDSDGHAYVAGDWSWNHRHPERAEYVEARMTEALRRAG